MDIQVNLVVENAADRPGMKELHLKTSVDGYPLHDTVLMHTSQSVINRFLSGELNYKEMVESALMDEKVALAMEQSDASL